MAAREAQHARQREFMYTGPEARRNRWPLLGKVFWAGLGVFMVPSFGSPMLCPAFRAASPTAWALDGGMSLACIPGTQH